MLWVTNGSVPLCGSTLNWNTRKDVTTQWQMHLAELLLNWTQTQWDQSSHGVTLGSAYQAKVHDPAVVEGWLLLGARGMCHATGCALVQMHVTDWAEAQKEDPMLSAVLNWLKAQKKTDLKALLAEHTSKWRRSVNLTESAEFYGSSRGLVPAFNALRWD